MLSLLGLPSLLGAILLTVYNAVKNRYGGQKEQQKAIKEGMVAILHNMVYVQGKAYIDKGKISVSDMKDYEYLYNAYHSLGGNGTGTEIYERVKDLQIE
jgi:lysophospholipid acyltransferase (LPLAT)-like uncharacterized protein